MMKQVYGCIFGACALVGCDQMPEVPLEGGPVEGGAAVEGRMGDDMAGRVSADTVTAITVDNVVLGEASVVDGAWRIEGLPPVDGAFFVEGRADGRVTGRVLVPMGAGEDSITPALPIDAESTAEAAAFELLAATEGVEAVDAIGLIETITAEMAATAETESAAAAAMAAQIAERAALQAHTGFELTGRWLAELRAGAFEDFVEAIGGAGDAAGRAEADAALRATSALALESGLGIDGEARADAAAAAGFALVAALEGEPGFEAALRAAGIRAAEAEAEVIDGLVAHHDEARARAEEAFEAFAASLEEARTAVDVQAAHDALFAALSGAEGEADSVVAAIVAPALPDPVGLGGLPGGALDLASVVAITVDTRGALTVDSREPEAAGEAFAGLRAQARAAVAGQLDGGLPPAVGDVLAEVALAGASLPAPDRLAP